MTRSRIVRHIMYFASGVTLPGNAKKITCYVFLVVFSFWLGVALNYYGLLFESIHIEVHVSTDYDTSRTVVDSGPTGRGSPQAHRLGDEYVVPNIVHFIWFAPSNNKPLSFLNYVSIKSAHVIQKPEAILLHCNFLPAGEWWERLIQEVPLTLVHKKAPTTIHDQTISHEFHKGDVAKIEVLLEYGGIYLDYDVLLVNSLDPVRKYDATLGKEKTPKFIAGIILARKGALFLKLLYESYRNNYRALDWDYNCARVAYQIYLSRPDLLHVEPYKFTTPDWNDRHLLWDSVIDWKDLYLVHVMGHSHPVQYTPEIIKQLNSTFGEVMRFIYYGHSAAVQT